MIRILLLLVGLFMTAGTCEDAVTAAFGPTSSLDATTWDTTTTPTSTTCLGETVGVAKDDRTWTFTQTGNDLTSVLDVPELAFTEALGGDRTVDLTGTRDGADFTVSGTGTLINSGGCIVTSVITFTGTIQDDGTLSGSGTGSTSPNDLATCEAVIAVLGADLVPVYTQTCESANTLAATESEE